MKDPDKVLLPSRNLVLVAPRENEPGSCIPFTLLDHLPLDPSHRSAVEMIRKCITQRGHCSFDSRGQISNRIEKGPVEFIRLSPLQFAV